VTADASPGGCSCQPAPDCGGPAESGSWAQCHRPSGPFCLACCCHLWTPRSPFGMTRGQVGGLGWTSCPDPVFQGYKVQGYLSSLSSPPRRCLRQVFRSTWKPETLRVSWAGRVVWQAGWEGWAPQVQISPSPSPLCRPHSPSHSRPGPHHCHVLTRLLSSGAECPSPRQAVLCSDAAARRCRSYQPGELGWECLAQRRVWETEPPGYPGAFNKCWLCLYQAV
jgi:hypothetical protein